MVRGESILACGLGQQGYIWFPVTVITFHLCYVYMLLYMCVIWNIFFTGVLSVASRIDFEKIEQTSFRALVYDTGVPRLSATTVVYVTVRNINDNSPIYTQVNCSYFKVGKLYPSKIYLHQSKESL